MTLKTSLELVIVCLSLNLILSLVVRFVWSPFSSFHQDSMWMRNLYKFLSLFQLLLLYVPLIVFFVVLLSELTDVPGKEKHIRELKTQQQPETREPAASDSSTTGAIVRKMFIVLLSCLAGVAGIVLSWLVVYALSDTVLRKSIALILIWGLTVLVPVILWMAMGSLERYIHPPLQDDFRLYCIIGLCIGVGIAWILLTPFAMLIIGFKGVKM